VNGAVSRYVLHSACSSDQQSCSTPGPVSTGMVNHILGSTTGAGNLSRSNQPCRSTQPGHPSRVEIISTRQRVVMFCSWSVKAGMARVWWQVKLCDPLYNTCHV